MTGQVTGVRGRAFLVAGNDLLQQSLSDLADADLDSPSGLPLWSRRFVLAHVAGNAKALLRLLSWARTGVESRMYSSPEQRDADIAAGSLLPARALRDRVTLGMRNFDRAVADMPEAAWSATVITAQGRSVPAGEVPWMRAREVCIHAIDLGNGRSFADLPVSFCAALIDEITAWRSARADGPALHLTAAGSAGTWQVTGEGPAQHIELPLADLAAWLSGRARPAGLPPLPQWL